MNGGYNLGNRWAVMVLFLVAGCAREPSEQLRSGSVGAGPVTPSATTAEGTVAPEEPSGSAISVEETDAPAESVKNITIDGVQVANPLVVTGLARTFESNVVLRVRDARGALLSETFTTATGEMGTHSPYRGTLWLTRDPGPSVTVEALEHSAKDGSEQSLVSAQRPVSIERIEARLFFPDANCTRVVPHVRSIPKSVSAARLLVEALIDGPTAAERKAGAAAAFPEGSRVESVNLRAGTLTVDFNERLQNAGGSCRAVMIRDSVTSTLLTIPAVKKVVITAGGSEKLALQP